MGEQQVVGSFGNVLIAAVGGRLHHEQALHRRVWRTSIEGSISQGLLVKCCQGYNHRLMNLTEAEQRYWNKLAYLLRWSSFKSLTSSRFNSSAYISASKQ